MELFDFTKLLKDLSDYYERKEPKQGTAELWFEKVKRIPNEPIPWITNKIYQECESFPKNLPSILWGFFSVWRDAYPEKIATRTLRDCPDCSDGTIRVWISREDGTRTSHLFRCGRCRQDTTRGWPMMSRDEMLSEGWEPEPKNPLPGPYKKRQPVKAIIKEAAESMTAPCEYPEFDQVSG